MTPEFYDRRIGTQISEPATNQDQWAERYRQTPPEVQGFMGRILDALSSESWNAIPGAGPLAKMPGKAAGAIAGLGSMLGMFVGPKSKVWDSRNAALAAQEAIGNTHSDLDIWKRRGLFKDVDKAWKGEISDAAATLKQDLPRSQFDDRAISLDLGLHQAKPLQDVLDHPELYKAYPDIRHMAVRGQFPWGGTGGSFNPITGIRVGVANEKDFRSTLLHEIQHAIQEYEGWAKGGGVQEFLPQGFSDQRQKINEMIGTILPEMKKDIPNFNSIIYKDALKRIAQGKELSPWEADMFHQVKRHPKGGEMGRLLEYHNRMDTVEESAYEQYRKLAGEVQARNTEKRAILTDSERRVIHPGDTADYAPSEQTVRFDYGHGSKAEDFKPLKGAQHIGDAGLNDTAVSWAKMLADRWDQFNTINRWGIDSGMTPEQSLDAIRKSNMLPLGYEETMKLKQRPQGSGN